MFFSKTQTTQDSHDKIVEKKISLEMERLKGSEGEEELADQYCRECGEELTDTLGDLDKELIKLGFLRGGGPHDVLQKPFPFTYNDWFEGILQEINPKFYINDTYLNGIHK